MVYNAAGLFTPPSPPSLLSPPILPPHSPAVDMLLSGWRPASRPSAHVSEPPTSTSASASANASVGVARIRRREQEKQAVQSQLMDAALTDLGALMDRAAEVVKLSEELARQMRR